MPEEATLLPESLVSRLKSVKASKYEEKIQLTKKKARSELDVFKGWTRFGYADQSFWVDPRLDQVQRISYAQVSKEEFMNEIELKAEPVVITDAMSDWKAPENWSLETFLETYRNEKFKIGEDDDGSSVYLGLKYFMKYALMDPEGASKDDSPLYIFDSAFADRKTNNSARHSSKKGKKKQSSQSEGIDEADSQPTCKILNDFQVPSYFEDDLFKLTGERRRPPYRWIVIGPGRSGTGIHIDPLGTSAWNALVSGHKRWVLFPPGTPKTIYEPKGLKDHEASTWFSYAYPKLVKTYVTDESENSSHPHQTLAQKYGMVDLIQYPGETVFVPGGWAHVVMNLDMTVAVTQNFCSRNNLEYVWLKTRHSRPKLAQTLYRRLCLLGRVEVPIQDKVNSTEQKQKRKKRKMNHPSIDAERSWLIQHLKLKMTPELEALYRDCAHRIGQLDTVPALKRNSSSSSSSSTSSSSTQCPSDI